MQKGKVKFWNEAKAFGLITPDGGGADIIVLSSTLIDHIRVGDVVSFHVEQAKKSLIAIQVRVI